MVDQTSEKEEIFRVSPDGRQVAFVRDNDLYTLDIATGTERRYTYDGSEDILNGRASMGILRGDFGTADEICCILVVSGQQTFGFLSF